MKIDSMSLYDGLDNYCNHLIPSAFFDYEFTSLYEVAINVRNYIIRNNLCSGIVFMNNSRYIYVRLHSFDVHYHGFYTDTDKERSADVNQHKFHSKFYEK